MKIIVSACLLGDNVKYDGTNNFNKDLNDFLKNEEVIKVCPEVMGGLTIPRIPSEVLDNKVLNQEGEDVTSFFSKGALKVLKIAKSENIKIAILKSKSPSCGSNMIYDGTFTHTLTRKDGVCANLLKQNGITVLDENNYQSYFKKDR